MLLRLSRFNVFYGLLVAADLLGLQGAAQEREKARSTNTEKGSAEERSQRSSERERGARGTAERGTRTSAERERGARRSAEGERGVRRAAEGGEGRRSEGERRDPLQGFRPQTKREAALYQMIVQLRQEVAALRSEIRSVGRNAAANRASQGQGREGGGPAVNYTLPARWQTTKEGRVFLAYDKNRDGIVSVNEWLAMTNGNINASRRALQTKRFNEAEPSGDGRFTPAEFIYWYKIGRHQQVQAKRSARDTDSPRGDETRRDGDRSSLRRVETGSGRGERERAPRTSRERDR